MEDERQPGPVVVGANGYRFRSGEEIEHDRVMSLCFLWVVEGGGQVVSGERTGRLDKGSLLRLPWGHHVRYRADERRPFHLGTLHLVPRHAAGTPVVPRVAHRPGDPLLHDPARRGDPRSPGWRQGSAADPGGARLVHLGSYAVERWLAEPFDEVVGRALGRLLLAEDAVWSRHRPAPRLAPPLAEMVRFVRGDLARRLSVADVAAAGGCSTSTAQRLFREGTGSSVQGWVRRTRMEEAARLLRGSALRVGEVAAVVGYPDPLHFSRVFSQTFGTSPSRYGRGDLRP
ncbi:AraC family transcriptional regulator [Microlunatus capsulatus]|uniref:helix-turn-helix transcriptional regulator n=1 Tax=Microlunatus capsulatus TaxID=99117 RepID=UPI0031DE7A60